MFESLNNGPKANADGGVCVVICSDKDVVRQVTQSLAECGNGRVISYDNPSDLAGNIPISNADMVVFAGEQSPELTYGMVRWSRRVWRNCVTVVMGNPGQRELEIASRRGGAYYLTKPTSGYDWDMILEGVRQNRSYHMSHK